MVLRNTTLNLPDDLVALTKAYAAEHGTTMTAIVREHLETVTGYKKEAPIADPLLAYSRGEISRADALQALGLRDYAALLVALGEADLPMSVPPPHEIENQATLFERIWRSS